MLTKPQPPRIHLPKGWQHCVKPVQMFQRTIFERHLQHDYSVEALPLQTFNIYLAMRLSRQPRKHMRHS